MYYPIIDKLKEVMEDIGQGSGGPLVIEAEQTSNSGGTWTGDFSDIISALNNGTPCILKYDGTDGVLYNVFIMAVAESLNMAIGYVGRAGYTVNSDNTFSISV